MATNTFANIGIIGINLRINYCGSRQFGTAKLPTSLHLVKFML